jgi:hypothetical protein
MFKELRIAQCDPIKTMMPPTPAAFADACKARARADASTEHPHTHTHTHTHTHPLTDPNPAARARQSIHYARRLRGLAGGSEAPRDGRLPLHIARCKARCRCTL